MQEKILNFIEFTQSKVSANGKKRKRALFKCNCGSIKDYDYESAMYKNISGCWDCSRKKVSALKRKHCLIKHPLYRKWQDMKKRCYNPKVDRYKNYGALGIKVCSDWKDNFLSFYNWSLENGWKEGLTIERKDNYKNYCPENCKYITHLEQHYNKKNTFFVNIKGVNISLVELLRRNHLINKRVTIWIGLKKGTDFSYYIEKYNLKL